MKGRIGMSKKRRIMNTIWLVLAVVSFFSLIGTAFGHMSEISARQWGHSFEADYIEDEQGVRAEYLDENGELHSFNLNGHDPVHTDGKVMMYYTTDMDGATPENKLSSQLVYYVLFGAVFGVSMWKVKKMTKGI